MHDESGEGPLQAFWRNARRHAHLESVPGYFGQGPLELVVPPAWSFGADSEQADDLLALVLDGTKTATAGALWDYESEGEQLPRVGDLSIILDGQGLPRALIRATSVEVMPFDEVTPEHAAAEGEGDLSLAHWREVHRQFFTEVATHDRGFSEQMPVVLEHFELVYSA